MGTPHPEVPRHQYIQGVFAREMARALKQHIQYLSLPADERRWLLFELTHTALCVIDDTSIDEEDGSPVMPVLAFFPEDSEGKRIGEAICHPHSTYLHELMPPDTDEVFDCEKEE